MKILPQNIIELRQFKYGTSCIIPDASLKYEKIYDISLQALHQSLRATIYGRDVHQIIVPVTWWDGFKLWIKGFRWIPFIISRHIHVRFTKISTVVLYPEYSPKELGTPVRFAEYSCGDVIERRTYEQPN